MIKDKEELYLKHNANCDDISEYGYKKDIVKNNKLSERISSICAFCMLPVASFYALISIFNPALLASKVTIGILIGTSISFGLLANNIVEKKFLKLKQKLRNFSDSKTEQKLLEEETRYQMVYEIAKNRNLAIDKALEILDSEEQREVNKEEIEKKNIDLELQKLNNDLTILTRKKILANKFWRYRSKVQPIVECFIFSIIVASLISTILTIATSSLLSVLIPFPASLLVGTIFTAKATKENRKVYNKLNQELRYDALPKKRNYEKEKGYEVEINKIIDSICNLYVQSIDYNKLISETNIEEIKNQNTISKQYTDEYFDNTNEKDNVKRLIKK